METVSAGVVFINQEQSLILEWPVWILYSAGNAKTGTVNEHIMVFPPGIIHINVINQLHEFNSG